jgi:DNA mismatch endonuclease, patch repair protein
MLRSRLHAIGLVGYRTDHRIPTSRRVVRADIAYTRWRVAVFVDGCFWHGCPEHSRVPRANGEYWTAKFAANARRDREVDALLTEQGWTVLRVWEHTGIDDAARSVGEMLERLGRSPTVPVSRRHHR